MLCTHQQQECPRHAGSTPESGQPQRPLRPARHRQPGAVDLALPRVLSAGTFALAVASAAVLMLAGCASPGPQAAPAVARTAASVGLAADRQTTGVDAQWWHQFGDSQLDALVAKALEGAPSLGAAAARVARAQAVVDATRGAEAPQVGFDASV